MPSSRSRTGARGEEVARRSMEAKGYQVVTTNYRCPAGEADIIAWDGACLVFVEVRTRRSLNYGTPEESISRQKAARLIATAETYVQGCATPPQEWRIDLAPVRVDSRGVVARIDHIQNAIEEG